MTAQFRTLSLLLFLAIGFGAGRIGKGLVLPEPDPAAFEQQAAENCLTRTRGLLSARNLPRLPEAWSAAYLAAPPAPPTAVAAVSPKIPRPASTPPRPTPPRTPKATTPASGVARPLPSRAPSALPTFDLGPVEGTDELLAARLLEQGEGLCRQLKYGEARGVLLKAAGLKVSAELAGRAREAAERAEACAGLAAELKPGAGSRGERRWVLMELASGRAVEGELFAENDREVVLTGRSGATGTWKVSYPRDKVRRLQILTAADRRERNLGHLRERLAEAEKAGQGIDFYRVARFCAENDLPGEVDGLLQRALARDPQLAETVRLENESQEFFLAYYHYLNNNYSQALAELDRFEKNNPGHRLAADVADLRQRCRQGLEGGGVALATPPASPSGGPEPSPVAVPTREPGLPVDPLDLWPINDPSQPKPTRPVRPRETPRRRPPPTAPASGYTGDPIVGPHHDGASDSAAAREGDKFFAQAREALRKAPPGHPDFQRQNAIGLQFFEKAKAAYERAVGEDPGNQGLKNRLQEVRRQIFWCRKSQAIRT